MQKNSIITPRLSYKITLKLVIYLSYFPHKTIKENNWLDTKEDKHEERKDGLNLFEPNCVEL